MSVQRSSNAACTEKLCLDLDSLVMQYFETFNELCNLKQQLEATMKDGYLYMAKVSISSRNVLVCNSLHLFGN